MAQSRDGRAGPVAHRSCRVPNSLARGSRATFHGRRELAHRSVGSSDGNANRCGSVAPCGGRVHDCGDCNVYILFRRLCYLVKIGGRDAAASRRAHFFVLRGDRRRFAVGTRAHLRSSATSHHHCHCGSNRGIAFSGTRQRDEVKWAACLTRSPGRK